MRPDIVDSTQNRYSSCPAQLANFLRRISTNDVKLRERALGFDLWPNVCHEPLDAVLVRHPVHGPDKRDAIRLFARDVLKVIDIDGSINRVAMPPAVFVFEEILVL